MSSLDSIADGLQSFVDSIKIVTQCSNAGKDTLKHKEAAQALLNEADKKDVTDSDFQEYKKQVKNIVEILGSLEGPSEELNKESERLKSFLMKVISSKELTQENFSQIKTQLDSTMKIVTIFKDKAVELKNGIEKAKDFCEKAISNAQKEADGLQKDASSKKKTGIGGAGLAGIGIGALALGIAGIATGGAAFVAAGVAGVTLGGAATVGGAVVAESAVLSVMDLKNKADEFRGAIKKIKLARTGLENLEEDMKGGTLQMSEDMVKSLEIGLKIYGKMEEDRLKMDEMAGENVQLKDENAALREELERLKMSQGK